MVEVDPDPEAIGADGPVPMIDIFDGPSSLIADFPMQADESVTDSSSTHPDDTERYEPCRR